MVTCSVKGCKSKPGRGIKFHRLPQGENREAWIKFLKHCNPFFRPVNLCIHVCGLHFSSDLDYEIVLSSINQTKRLKKNAVPSILNQDICESLLHKPNQEFNYVTNHDAEEDVTLSSPDLFAGLKSVPPAIPLPEIYENYLILGPIKNASTVLPTTVFLNRNEVPPTPVIQNGILPSFEQDTDDETLLTPNNKRKHYLGDFKEVNDIDRPSSQLKYSNNAQPISNSQQTIKLLYKKTAYFKMKIKRLEKAINQQKDRKKKNLNNFFTKKVFPELFVSSSQHEIYMSMCIPS